MRSVKNTQPQGVEQMEGPQEFTVTLPNSQQGTVTVDEHGGVLLDNTQFTEVHSLTSLVNKTRRNALPEWARQVPGLVSRIEAVFTEERKKGMRPVHRLSEW
jgi:hypothetical protein